MSELRPDRVIDDLRELAALTSDDDGAQRVAFTPAWDRARRFLIERLDAIGAAVELDEAGNLWATLPGERPDAVAIGGHLDSVPNGGWLDGALNVLAGLEVLRRAAAAPTRPVTLRLVDFADEEGARFGGQSTLGSGLMTGCVAPDGLAAMTDRDGVTLGETLAAYGIDLDRAPDARTQLRDVRAYLELHVEQGPVLEDLDLPLAAVTGTIGLERHAVHLVGQAAHAGATAMDRRRDAFLAGARIALATRAIAIEAGGFGTCGSVRLVPGIPTAVAGECDIVVDLRHEDQPTLERMFAELRGVAADVACEECVEHSFSPVYQVPATRFDAGLVDLTRTVVEEVSGSVHAMPSATLHDATRMAQAGIPTAMVFVQSLGGVSHTKVEDTHPEHLALGVRALADLADATVARVAAAAG